MAHAISQPVAAIEPALPHTQRWPLAQRVIFRFLCAYLVLYALPDSGRLSIFSFIPGVESLYTKLWHNLCPWVAIRFFHVTGQPATYFRTGSGDTTLAYIQNLLFVIFALVIALAWSVLDRRRPNYITLHAWLRLMVRYTVAFTLFSYGFAKVFPLQFRTPNLLRLLEPYGDFSPMGALWWFMGASTAYIVFSGVCEVLGGVFLIFRRTATLGALISFAVLLNVMVLNYCYDVPVKLYSTNLVLMAAFLAAPDFRRLLDFFVFNRATPASDLTGPTFARRWARIAVTVFQVLFVGYALFEEVRGGWTGYQQTYINPQRPPLYGLYDVETFTRNGKDVLPLTTEATRWRKVIIEFPGFVNVKMMNDAVRGFPAEYDPNKNVVNLNKSPFVWTHPDADHLILEGRLDNDDLKVRLKSMDPNKFPLLNRGYHWINEFPFNR